MITFSDQFRSEVEEYLTATDMKPTQFGVAALKDPGFVFELRTGRSPTLKTIDRVRAWMAENPANEAAA